LDCPLEVKRQLVEPAHDEISVRRQCQLLGLNRASFYYAPRVAEAENLELMRLLDEQYTRSPFYGVRLWRAAHHSMAQARRSSS
jgi:putative transposase